MDNKMQKTYINMLNNDKIAINDIMEQMKGHVPPKLYRYMEFGKWWKENLFKGSIHLSEPKTFNDPFDSVPFVNMEEFWDKYGRSLFEMNNGLDLEMKEREVILAYNEMVKFTQEEMRVCCFTERKDSLLMWAHYAQSHKGFCIEYDTSKMPDNIRKIFLPVIYQKQIYDSTHDFKPDGNNIFNFLFYKSDEWSYEKEWRIAVYNKQIRKEMNFADYISSVYLGIKCEKENKQEILEWAKEKGITIYQEYIDYNGYNVVMKKL